MVITKQSWRYDSNKNRYVSGRQGGGYIYYDSSRKSLVWVDNAGKHNISNAAFESQLRKGERAESSYNLQRSRERRLKAGEDRLVEVTSKHGTSIVKLNPQQEIQRDRKSVV